MSRERADQAVRRFALVTLVLPGVIATVGLIIQLITLRRMSQAA